MSDDLHLDPCVYPQIDYLPPRPEPINTRPFLGLSGTVQLAPREEWIVKQRDDGTWDITIPATHRPEDAAI